MAKKVVSVALRKKIPIKHSSRRKNLKSVLKNIFNYLKSDTYMFAPLLHRHSYFTLAPTSFGEVSCESIKRKETKLVQDVGHYLKSDCYMYAPIIIDDTAGLNLGRKAETASMCDQMGARTEETIRQEGNTLNNTTRYDDRYNPTRRIVVKHNVFQQATVKHIVQQSCGITCAPGEALPQKEKHKILVE